MIEIAWIRRHAHWFYAAAAIVLTILWFRARNAKLALVASQSALTSASPDSSNAFQPDLSSFFANLYAGGSGSQSTGGAINSPSFATASDTVPNPTLPDLPYAQGYTGGIVPLTVLPGGPGPTQTATPAPPPFAPGSAGPGDAWKG